MIKTNDPTGYKLLCDNYSAIVYGSIVRMVNDTYVAEELLKQTFHKICKNIDEYPFSKLTFVSWALQLARSLSIDYLSFNKQHRPIAAGNNNIVPGSVELTIIPTVNDNDNCMDIFNMTIQGLKAHEIAEKLTIGIETVKTGLRKGMKLKLSSIN